MVFNIVDYFRSEITTGISIESQPSGVYSENTTPVYQTHGQNFRSRVETRYKSESHGNNQLKRLSLVSSDSAATSGIHDMNTTTESDIVIKTEIGSPIATSCSFTYPHKPIFSRNEKETRVESSNTTNALVDKPFRQPKYQDSEPETHFVRNAIKRRTLHVDFPVDEVDVPTRQQVSQTKSNPIISTMPLDIQPKVSPSVILDEVDEESECQDGGSSQAEFDGDSSSSKCVHSISVSSLPVSPVTPPVSPLQSSTPCIASASSRGSESPKFTYETKDKGAKSKEKGKDKHKKVITLVAIFYGDHFWQV